MKVTKTLALAVAAIAIGTGSAMAQDADLIKRANEVFEPIPTMVPTIRGISVTREKVELGKMLFFEPRLSSSALISCNTCHNLGMGGDDALETSIGHGWQKGPRNAPTVFNAVFNTAQFWDGRAEDLKAQAMGPVQAAVEMAATPKHVVEVLNSMPEYRERFDRAFPGAQEAVTFENMAEAIEAFEATLITPRSRFDQFLQGDANILSAQEKSGLNLFMEKGCSACHAGVNLGGDGYYPFGVVERPGADILPPEDKGRFLVTQTADAEYVFRAGPLRNIALTAPYFHSGRVWDLEQAVAIMGTSQLGEELAPNEVSDITAFLRTLSGERPRVEYPLLPARTAETPRPAAMVAE